MNQVSHWPPKVLLRFGCLAIGMLSLCSGCRSNPSLLQPLERGLGPKLQEWQADPKVQGKATLFSLEVESKLQAMLERSAQSYDLPGAVIGIASSQQRWMAATGQANVANQTDLLPTDRFRIGNLSEMLMAVVCLQLQEEGVLSLSDPIRDWLPEAVLQQITGSDRITIRQLLNHTSAIPDLDQAAFRQAVLTDPAHRWQPKELLLYQSTQPVTRPRGMYTYSAINYLLLQLILERATGESFASVIQTHIAQPLKLKNTFVELSIKQTPVHGYQDWDGNGSSEDVMQPFLNTGIGHGEQAIVSNVPDLLHFMQALFLENQLLTPTSLQEMLTIVETRRGGYGLGILNNLTRWGEVWGQTSTTTGFSAVIFYIPLHDLILVSWTNSGDATEAKPIELVDQSLDIVLGSSAKYLKGPAMQW